MTPTRTTRGIVAAALGLALALTGCSGTDTGTAGDSQKLETVKIGHIADYDGTSLLAVAAGQDLWKKHGLKVEASVFTNGPLQIQAIGTGDLDFGYIGPGAMWLPASGQAKIVAINSVGNSDRVIAQAGITSLKDLKGKTVAVPEGTSGEMILTLALKSVGLTVKDIKKVAMDPSTVVPAFVSKKVDAAGIWYPLVGTIEKQVPDLKILAANEDFKNDVSFPTAFVSGNDFVKKNPKTVSKVLQVLREAMDYRAAHTDEAIKLTAGMLKLDAGDVAADAKNITVMTSGDLDKLTKDGTVVRWLTGMNDYFISAGKLPSPVDPTTYYTGDLFTGAGK